MTSLSITSSSFSQSSGYSLFINTMNRCNISDIVITLLSSLVVKIKYIHSFRCTYCIHAHSSPLFQQPLSVYWESILWHLINDEIANKVLSYFICISNISTDMQKIGNVLKGNERSWSTWQWLKSTHTPSNCLFKLLYNKFQAAPEMHSFSPKYQKGSLHLHALLMLMLFVIGWWPYGREPNTTAPLLVLCLQIT